MTLRYLKIGSFFLLRALFSRLTNLVSLACFTRYTLQSLLYLMVLIPSYVEQMSFEPLHTFPPVGYTLPFFGGLSCFTGLLVASTGALVDHSLSFVQAFSDPFLGSAYP
jgi:hypothetical protein